MLLARNDGIFVVRLPPSPPNPVTKVIGFFVTMKTIYYLEIPLKEEQYETRDAVNTGSF